MNLIELLVDKNEDDFIFWFSPSIHSDQTSVAIQEKMNDEGYIVEFHTELT